MAAIENELKRSDETERRLAYKEIADRSGGDPRTIDRVVLELLLGAIGFVVLVMTASAIIA